METIAVLSGLSDVDISGPEDRTAAWAVRKLAAAQTNILSMWSNGWAVKTQAVTLGRHAQATRDAAEWKRSKALFAEGSRVVRRAAEEAAENDKLRGSLYSMFESRKVFTPEAVAFLTARAGLLPPSPPPPPFPADSSGLGAWPVAYVAAYGLVGLATLSIGGYYASKVASHFDGSANSAEYTRQLKARNEAVLAQIAAGVPPEVAHANNPPPPPPKGGISLGKIGVVLAIAAAGVLAILVVPKVLPRRNPLRARRQRV